MAPTIKSCRVSMSAGSTTLGSICTPTTSPLPLTTTFTRPPPASPCTSALASCCWASSNFCCICCAWASSADISPPGCMTIPSHLGLELVSPVGVRRFETPSVDRVTLPLRRGPTSEQACRNQIGDRCDGCRLGGDHADGDRGPVQHRRHGRLHRSRSQRLQ